MRARHVLLSVPVLMCAGAAAAQDGAPAPAFDVSVAATTAGYDAVEPGPGGRNFNSEHGRLHGAAVGLGWSSGPWRAGLLAAQDQGRIGYAGQSQLGLPIFTTTALTRRRLAPQLGYRWPLGGGAELLAQAGLGWREVERRIEPTPASSALNETLQTLASQLGAGVQAQLQPGGMALRLRGALLWTRPLRQRLQVDADGAFDPVTLRPAARSGGQLDLGAELQLSPLWSAGLQATLERWRPGASDSRIVWRQAAPVGAASYPGSSQRSRQWQVVLRLSL